LNTPLAKSLSVFLHPLLMPTILLGLLFFTTPAVVGVDMFTPPIRLTLLGFVGMTTFVIPALGIYYLYRSGSIKSLHLDTLADRRLPYFVTVLLYGFATYFFRYQLARLSDLAPQISIILASITVSIALVAVVSLNWKISAHGTGLGGLIGAIFGIVVKFGEHQLLYPLLGLIILGGLLMSARLYLNAHTPAQIIAGVGLGLLVSLTTVWWFV